MYTEISIKIDSKCPNRVTGKVSLVKKGYNNIEIHKNYTNWPLLVTEWSVNHLDVILKETLLTFLGMLTFSESHI